MIQVKYQKPGQMEKIATFSEEIHGKDFEKLATEFKDTNNGEFIGGVKIEGIGEFATPETAVKAMEEINEALAQVNPPLETPKKVKKEKKSKK